jgi:hypothetical protein
LDAAVVSRLSPWAGWAGGLLGWVLSDQAGSDLAQWNCTNAAPPLMLAIGAGGALLALAGGLVSFRVWRALSADLYEPSAGTRRFIAATGALAAGIFTLAIVFQTVSSLIIPRCHA